ncbi:MAG: type IV secretion protein IcmT [Rhodospirillales bacterium]|nr:type IV secretion protein IcmT [Rhodospirillales bacterium]MCB9996971.1 type IV secretion protein IcmT [Rhodospirillales bacterium]
MATAQDDLEIEKKNWHWRNTMRPVRFFGLDARAALPFFILLVYARPVTIVLTLLIVIFFYILERFGLTYPAALRSMRSWMVGDRRNALFTYAYRRMRDYG